MRYLVSLALGIALAVPFTTDARAQFMGCDFPLLAGQTVAPGAPQDGGGWNIRWDLSTGEMVATDPTGDEVLFGEFTMTCLDRTVFIDHPFVRDRFGRLKPRFSCDLAFTGPRRLRGTCGDARIAAAIRR